MNKNEVKKILGELEREKEKEKIRDDNLNNLQTYGYFLPTLYLPFLVISVLVAVISPSVLTFGLTVLNFLFLILLLHISNNIFNAYIYFRYDDKW